MDILYRAKENYIHRKIAENDVLIPIGGNVANFNGYIELNASAAFLWDALKAPCSKEDLVKALVKEFDIDEAIATEDVEYFLELVTEKNMLEVTQDGNA